MMFLPRNPVAGTQHWQGQAPRQLWAPRCAGNLMQSLFSLRCLCSRPAPVATLTRYATSIHCRLQPTIRSSESVQVLQARILLFLPRFQLQQRTLPAANLLSSPLPSCHITLYLDAQQPQHVPRRASSSGTRCREWVAPHARASIRLLHRRHGVRGRRFGLESALHDIPPQLGTHLLHHQLLQAWEIILAVWTVHGRILWTGMTRLLSIAFRILLVKGQPRIG
mmetsp:Transcript_38243/g.89788  ORF Transcript_38243/g.89788 Transcript_38243/m.89788 type:complete len:223 (+) Transcript_38243:1251-1919(+)